MLSFRTMHRATLAVVLAPLAFALVAAAPAPEQPVQPPPDPNLTGARAALVAAQEHLRLADTGKKDQYGTHRKLALELVNTAISEVDAGLRIAADEAARKAREAKEAESRKKRKRR